MQRPSPQRATWLSLTHPSANHTSPSAYSQSQMRHDGTAFVSHAALHTEGLSALLHRTVRATLWRRQLPPPLPQPLWCSLPGGTPGSTENRKVVHTESIALALGTAHPELLGTASLELPRLHREQQRRPLQRQAPPGHPIPHHPQHQRHGSCPKANSSSSGITTAMAAGPLAPCYIMRALQADRPCQQRRPLAAEAVACQLQPAKRE